MIREAALSRDDAGIIQTRTGRWHVFRHGSPFSCARGATSMIDEAGPYAAVETVTEEAMGRLPQATAREIRDLLREKHDAGATICLHCASCYDIAIHSTE